MARIERRARFMAPVNEVFAYIADFRTLREYNPSVLRVESDTQGPPTVGSRFGLTISMFGMKLHPLLSITEIRENELIVTRLDSFIPAVEKRLFQQVGNHTDFCFTIEFSSGWSLLGPLIDTILRRCFAEQQAETEKRLLERRFNVYP